MKPIFKNMFIGLILIVCQGAFGMEPDLDTQLFVAARTGDRQKVKWLLSQGANIDADNGNPLRAALKNGHLEVAKLLLDHNANVEALSLVMQAHDYGQGETIDASTGKKSLLLEVCDQHNIVGTTWNVGSDMRKAIVKLLLAYGANPMFITKKTTQVLSEVDYTPLGFAAPNIAMILVAAISNADAEQIRKNFYASMRAINIKGKKEGVNADARRLLAKTIFDGLVQMRMQRAEDMIKRANRKDLMGDYFKRETRKMIAAEMKRILSCSGDEYSSEDPSEWKPDLSCTIL
jgi:hypothetical protein